MKQGVGGREGAGGGAEVVGGGETVEQRGTGGGGGGLVRDVGRDVVEGGEGVRGASAGRSRVGQHRESQEGAAGDCSRRRCPGAYIHIFLTCAHRIKEACYLRVVWSL